MHRAEYEVSFPLPFVSVVDYYGDGQEYGVPPHENQEQRHHELQPLLVGDLRQCKHTHQYTACGYDGIREPVTAREGEHRRLPGDTQDI